MTGYSAMMLAVVLSVLLICFSRAEIGDKDFVPFYQCSFCVASMDKHLSEKVSIQNACLSMFTPEICGELNFPESVNLDLGLSSRDYCRQISKCPAEDLTLSNSIATSAGVADVRISRAVGKRGYDKVRVSVISNETISNSLFDYSQKFKYRWTDKYLSTGIVSVTPGKATKLTIAGKEYTVTLPKENEGVRGIIIADPCFQSEWIHCLYQDKFKTKSRHIEFLNAAFGHSDVHYWQILGDNFYDQQGAASSSWFADLSTATKSAFFATVPGNHDFWVNSSPRLYVPQDQLGNGFMQFYGQDVVASLSTADHAPYDFSVNPDADGKHKAESIPYASNYFFYNKVGNVAFIGYSGAHRYSTMVDYVREACDYAVTSKAETVFLVGHWNSDGDGCDADAAVPKFYEEMLQESACKPLAGKTRYFMGHKHCNIITQKDVGFMVGAQGMSDATSCGGAFGIPIADTTDGRFRVYYFPLAQANSFDHSDEIISCVKEHGISGCYHLATVWADVPL
jgi:hypothetical protein